MVDNDYIGSITHENMVDNGRYFSIPKRREWRHKPTIFFTVQLNLTL